MELTARQWDVHASKSARRTINPIRSIVDNMKLEPHPQKKMISLSIGDPTLFGNLETCPKIIDSLVEKARSFKYNGYPPAIGTLY
jgi:tyrosine aminotransferase